MCVSFVSPRNDDVFFVVKNVSSKQHTHSRSLSLFLSFNRYIISFNIKDDLIELAYKLNPKLGYYDPLNIVDTFGIYGKEEAWIGWLRQSEIKHGRVAMMGFVGYIVQCFYTFPYACKFDGTPFPSAQYSPPQQWDELPTIAKLHFFIFIGFLEWYNELSSTTTTTTTTTTDRDTKNANVDNVDDDLWSEWKPTGQLHYTKGGQPGKVRFVLFLC